MGKDYTAESDVIERALYVIKNMGVFYLLASCGCFGCGVMTLWFAQANYVFPYNTGSGVWTGITTFAMFILGCRIVKHFSASNPEDTRRQVIVYYTLTIMTITFSVLHITYSLLGYQYCKDEFKTGQQHCFADEMPRLMLMEGLSTAFGVINFIVSLFGTIYFSTGKRLQKLTGRHGHVTGSEYSGGWEVQNNCCL